MPELLAAAAVLPLHIRDIIECHTAIAMLGVMAYICDTRVERHTIYPCRHARIPAITVKSLPQIGEHFLIQVVKLLRVRGIHIAHLIDHRAVVTDNRHESRLFFAGC